MALTRSESLTNLPIPERDARTGMQEDIRNTWTKKTKKVASLTGAHVCEFHNLRLEHKNDQPEGTSICAEIVVMESEPFLLCGNMWSLKIYPHGVDEDSEHLGIKLQNLSEDVVNAYYALSIKRSDQATDSNRLNMWIDPDVCSLLFQPRGTEDSAWGVDDFLPLQALYSKELGYMDIFANIPEEFAKQSAVGTGVAEGKRFVGERSASATATATAAAEDDRAAAKHEGEGKSNEEKDRLSEEKVTAMDINVPCDVFRFRNARGEPIYDRLYVEVQMMVYGEVSLKAHPITQAIEKKNASEAELIALADLDLDLIRQGTKGGGVSLAELSAQQDNILAMLCLPRTADDKGREIALAADREPAAGPGRHETSRLGSRTDSRPGSAIDCGSSPGLRPAGAKARAVTTIEEKSGVVDDAAEKEGNVQSASLRTQKNSTGTGKTGSGSVTVTATVKYA